MNKTLGIDPAGAYEAELLERIKVLEQAVGSDQAQKLIDERFKQNQRNRAKRRRKKYA